MARYNDGTLYDSGARYGMDGSVKRKIAMIKYSVSNLTISQRVLKGAEIVTKETANPNVPGNTAVLATFSTAQTAFAAAVAAALAARENAKQATAAQDAAEAEWRSALALLASFTETATGGDPVKILTTGFDVRNSSTPTQPPASVENLMVKLDDAPGHSKLTWKPMARAEGYLVQGSPDPITATSWTASMLTSKASFKGNGATAGEKYWYRVAAFNGAGQGPWCQPASRPVM